MSPWPLSLESYGPFIKRLGHQGKSMGQEKIQQTKGYIILYCLYFTLAQAK